MSGGIYWIASYPKSGNTWFRAFLSNLRHDGAEPVAINKLDRTPIASSRELFDAAVGYESGELTHEEADRLRPAVYLHYAERASGPLFCKVHDGYTFLDDGRPLFSPEATAGALYLIRNPLDVAVSFAHHSGHGKPQRSIARMANPDFALCGERDEQPNQLRQRLLTWSDHVRSWVDAPGIELCVVRYEDMKATPAETFAAAARFLGLTDDPTAIERALSRSTFEELRRQEEEHGFREKGPQTERFFRRGEIGAWREALTDDDVARIVDAHRSVMRRFGYLTENDEPVF